MRLISVHARSVIILVCVITSSARQGESSVLEGPYLGQKPPGEAAQVFAPGIVSTEADEVLFEVFDDGSLIFFERKTADFDDDWIHAPVFRLEINDGVWKAPQRATTTGRPWLYEYSDAPEGTVIAFPWRKNLDGSGRRLDIDLWIVVKESNGWAEPQRFGPPVNTESFDSWPSLSRNETLYFFSTREGGLGKNDLYVAFRWRDGSWATPKNLGDGVNTPANETRPYVTPDGKYLFFNSTTSGPKDIYWVDSKILEDLVPEGSR